MMVLQLLFGLTAMFALLGFSVWMWLHDPVWPWTRPRQTELSSIADSLPDNALTAQPVPANTRPDEGIDQTRLEAVVFPALTPDPEPGSDRTQILSNHTMQDPMLQQSADMRINRLKLVEDGSAALREPASPMTSSALHGP